MDSIKDVINGSSLRYNSNKVKFTLIPAKVRQRLFELRSSFPFSQVPISSLIALANHYDYAQQIKYPNSELNGLEIVPNWTKGQWISAMYLNSAYRHLYAYMAGEINDSDLGSHHMIAVAWNLISIYHQLDNPEYYSQFDDRYWKHFNKIAGIVVPIKLTSTELLDCIHSLVVEIESMEYNNVDLIILIVGLCLWVVYIDTFDVYDTSELSNINMTFTPEVKNVNYGVANQAKG